MARFSRTPGPALAGPGDGDSWHLNSLTSHRGRLLACAFGRFSEHREWADPELRAGRGIVFDVRSGREVLSGLSAPHNPQWVDQGWLVCSSSEGELLRLDDQGRVLGRCSFSGWPRGLAYDSDHVYLGLSAHRMRGAEAGTAAVIVLNRETLAEVRRYSLPCREVFDLTLVPEPLLNGLRAGRRANPHWPAEQQGLTMPQASAQPAVK